MNRLVPVLLLVLGVSSACSKTRGPEAGSQTHFLSDCDGSCAAPYSCLCGVCTLACSGAAQCADASEAAACLVPSSATGSCSAAKLCDVECERHADCAAVGPQFSCEAGRCRETATGTEAGSSAGGRGGQGGAGGTTQSGAGGSAQGGAGGSGQGGASGGSCRSAADCVLISTGCCGACVPGKADVEAVPRSREAAETLLNCPMGPVMCGPCPPAVYDPEAPILRVECLLGLCAVLDLREQPQSECTSHADCNLAQQGCCGSCGGDPSEWISVSSGTTDPYPLTCNPPPPRPCPQCSDPNMPEPFCADDGHCAVREVARANGVPSTTCYSPAQNLESAYEPGAVGCDCITSGASLCVRDSTGTDVALTCDVRWMAIQDGPCGV
jgi:hypothetical protein